MKQTERKEIEDLGGRVVDRKRVMEGWKPRRYSMSDGGWIGLLV